MKKRLSILLIGSIIAVSFAGCNITTGKDSKSKENSTASSVSDTADDNAEENNNADGTDSTDDTADAEDGETVTDSSEEAYNPSGFIEIGYDTVDISDKEAAKANLDLKDIKTFTITSKKELDSFYKENAEKYFLDKVDGGKTFTEVSKEYDDDFYTIYNQVVVIYQYEKDTEVEPEAKLDDKEIKIDIYAKQPESTDKAAYSCMVLRYDKLDAKDAVPKVTLVNQNPIAPEGGEAP